MKNNLTIEMVKALLCQFNNIYIYIPYNNNNETHKICS